MGLRSMQQGDTTTARRQLRTAAKAENPLIARKAKIALAESFDSIEDKTDTLAKIYHEYNDEESLLPLCRELFENREYAKIIEETDGLDLINCANEIAYFRLSSMRAKNDSRLKKEYYIWCTERPFERAQYNLFSELEEEIPDVIKLRALCYTKNYANAIEIARKFLDCQITITPQIASDFGKIFLYGSANYNENAQYLMNIAKAISKEYVFYFYFYAGRIYDRSSDKSEKAFECYEKAMQHATTAELYDNALWYYLKAQLELSPVAAVKAIEKYSTKWHDPYYFDDFFDSLSYKLLTDKNYEIYLHMASFLPGVASKESAAKFCYTAARLLQENIYMPKYIPSKERIDTYLHIALDGGTSIYYKALAAKQLNLSNEEFFRNITVLKKDEDFTKNKYAEELLLGYADFGFAEKIYNDYLTYRDELSTETVKKLAQFLFSCGKTQDSYYTQSIRMASRKLNNCELTPDEIDIQLYKLSYPQAFLNDTSEFANAYGVEEYMMYALMRSESFFDPSIVSSAGAVGLTQLMNLTAGDVAKKLKRTQFDLRDARTNIQFGSYYLSEMIRRLSDSNILAAFAYNAGITRVRNWLSQTQTTWEAMSKKQKLTEQMPRDLFLETLPITETREYGRKILSASVIYGALYYNQSISDVIDTIFN